MAFQRSVPCLACGVETSNRCSSCAKAGIDLGFCSAAHQKLLWHLHKLVCGPGKANPFVWPRLTVEEAEDAIEHRNVAFLEHATTSMLIVSSGRAMSPVGIDNAIRALSVTAPPCRPEDVATEQRLLAHIRLFEEERNFGPRRTPHGAEYVVRVLRSMTTWTSKLDTDILEHVPTPPGRTPFLHRALAYYALAYSPAGTEASSLSGKAWAQVVRSFETELRPKDPALAREGLSELAVVVERAAERALRTWEAVRDGR